MINLKSRPYTFKGKVKDLVNDIQEEMESRELEEIEKLYNGLKRKIFDSFTNDLDKLWQEYCM